MMPLDVPMNKIQGSLEAEKPLSGNTEEKRPKRKLSNISWNSAYSTDEEGVGNESNLGPGLYADTTPGGWPGLTNISVCSNKSRSQGRTTRYVVFFDPKTRISRYEDRRRPQACCQFQSFDTAMEVAKNYSHFKLHGVREVKDKNVKEAFAVSHGKVISIGNFNTVDEAARAADFGTLRLRGIRSHMVNFEGSRSKFLAELRERAQCRKFLSKSFDLTCRSSRSWWQLNSQPDMPWRFSASRKIETPIKDRLANELVVLGRGLLAQNLVRHAELALVGECLLRFWDYLLNQNGAGDWVHVAIDCVTTAFKGRHSSREVVAFLRQIFAAMEKCASVERPELAGGIIAIVDIQEKVLLSLLELEQDSGRSTRNPSLLNTFFLQGLDRLNDQLSKVADADYLRARLLLRRACFLLFSIDNRRQNHSTVDLLREAEEVLKKSLRLDPTNIFTVSCLADAHIRLASKVGLSNIQRLTQTQSQNVTGAFACNENDSSGHSSSEEDIRESSKSQLFRRTQEDTFMVIRAFYVAFPLSEVAAAQYSRLLRLHLDITDAFDSALEYENASQDLINSRTRHLLREPHNLVVVSQIQQLRDQREVTFADLQVFCEAICNSIECLSFDQNPSLVVLLEALDADILCFSKKYELATSFWEELDKIPDIVLSKVGTQKRWWKTRFFSQAKHTDKLCRLASLMMAVGKKMMLV